MNASTFMDKQIMDLSRSKSDPNSINANTTNSDFIDLMNPQSEEEVESDGGLNNDNKKKDGILPNYDFHPIHRPSLQSFSSDHALLPPAGAATAASPSFGSKPNSTPLRSYNSLDHVEPDRTILERAQKVNDLAILSEIDRTMKRYTDSLMRAIDTVSARMSELENKTCHLELSVDDLKASVGSNHGSTDGKLRQLENILLEVQSGVQNLKDKQEVMDGHMQLAKLHISKAQQSEIPNVTHLDSVEQVAASAPPQQTGHQQFPIAVPRAVPFMLPPNASVPSSKQNIHPPQPVNPQYSPASIPAVPQPDAYFSPPSQTHEVPNQQYQIPPPPQHQQQPSIPAPQPQQYQQALTPPFPQPPQPPQQQHPSVVAGNSPQFQPPLGHRAEESPYVPPQTYPPNVHHSTSQPSSAPPHSQPYYGNPSGMYEPPPSSRPNSGFPSAYVPPSGASDPYPYGGPASHYGSGSSGKPQPHSPNGGSSNYPQLPTARILPQPIPTAAGVSGGPSSGGSGNRVPIDDVVDKVTNMGFPREHVKATVRKLTENGQSVDLNVVLDKLMNDGDVQPPRGWFNR